MAYMSRDRDYVVIRHIRTGNDEKSVGISLNEIKDALEIEEVREALYSFIAQIIKENLNITVDMRGEE